MGSKVPFSTLQGLTLTKINGERGDDEITFESSDGQRFQQFHCQDCCESVDVEDIVGDLSDLIGSPILLAEEVTSEDDPPGYAHEYRPESKTWTFYKLRTIKGSVDIRWLGTSNGYYSERVDFVRL